MRPNIESYKKIVQPDLLARAQRLPLSGHLEMTADDLVYLNISDQFINELFPLLSNEESKIIKPDYMGPNLIGAHISVIYPEEGQPKSLEELDTLYDFQPIDLFSTRLGKKIYYAIRVLAPPLIELRGKYGLAPLLSFKHQLIPLHITIGISLLSE